MTLAGMFALEPAGANQWQVDIPPDWSGWSGPHGGALAAIMTEAASETADPGSAVRACDMRFLGKPAIGKCALTATVRRVGRSVQAVDVTALQDREPVASATVVLGPERADQPARLQSRTAPDVPGPDACRSADAPREIQMLVPAGAHFDLRPAGGSLPITSAAEARMIAWISLVPELPISPAALIILADALPPGVFPVLQQPLVVPTVQLSVHFPAQANGFVEGPVLVDVHNVSTAAGWSIDDADIFDIAGTLIAQARQLRRVLGPVGLDVTDGPMR
jgi:acyl-CoA thioesterase